MPAPSREQVRSVGPGLALVLLTLSVLLIALAGYAGFRLYPRIVVPPAVGLGLFFLAGVGGFAAFFSPCSFPLLMTLLAREIGRESTLEDQHGRRAAAAVAMAAGAGLFLLLTGAGIAIGGGALFRQISFASPAGRILRTLVAVFLILLGLTQLGVIHASFHMVAGTVKGLLHTQAALRRDRPLLGYALLGFGYVFAGFG